MSLKDWLLLVLRVRSSCRRFDPAYKLSQEELDILIRSIDCGPSSGGLRAYSIYRTDDKNKKMVLQKASLDQGFISNSSVVFCICSDPQKQMEKYGERGNLYAIQDATIAGMAITFAATALGLSSCWVGSLDKEGEIRKTYNIKDWEVPLSLICIGAELKQ